MILKINQKLKQELLDFLAKIHIIGTLEDKNLDNTYVIKEEKIEAAIGYDIYLKTVVIKFFVFYKSLDFSLIKSLFEFLINDLKNVEEIISICYNFESIELFQKLGLEPYDSIDFYVNDYNVLKTEYKDAVLLRKRIVKNMLE